MHKQHKSLEALFNPASPPASEPEGEARPESVPPSESGALSESTPDSMQKVVVPEAQKSGLRTVNDDGVERQLAELRARFEKVRKNCCTISWITLQPSFRCRPYAPDTSSTFLSRIITIPSEARPVLKDCVATCLLKALSALMNAKQCARLVCCNWL